jgi:hemolysin III
MCQKQSAHVKPDPLNIRRQTSGEEIANSVSHGIGFLVALMATPFLILQAAHHGGAKAIVAVSLFSASVLWLYLASTLYHALPRGGAKRVWNILEHGAIFVLIAGTYTPVTLCILKGAWGWTLFGIVWTLAILGVIFKSIAGLWSSNLSNGLYVGMGWLVVAAVHPLYHRLPLIGFLGIALGGLAYTFGVPFYNADHRRYSHFIWHLFVLAGTTLHFLTIYFFTV